MYPLVSKFRSYLNISDNVNTFYTYTYHTHIDNQARNSRKIPINYRSSGRSRRDISLHLMWLHVCNILNILRIEQILSPN